MGAPINAGGYNPWSWESMAQGAANFVDTAGKKANQFGRWAGDQLGLNVGTPYDPSVFAPDLANYNADRANQTALYDRLNQQSLGNGPSLAQGQLQQATDQNIRQAMALGAAQQGQGLGYASALRNIADQSAMARQQAAGQSALIRNAEMMQALQQMQGLGLGMGGQGLDATRLGMQGQQFGAQLEANRQAQEASNRRQFWGGIAGGLSSNLAQGIMAPLTGGASLAMPSGGGAGGGPGAGYGIPAMSSGGTVPGMAHGGAMDSPQNDTVPAMLSPGEVVLPRSVTMASDAPDRAEAFVRAIMERRKKGPPGAEEHMLTHAAGKRKAS